MNPFKPDWPEAEDRLTALWERRHAGRPCIAVTAPLEAAAHRTELWNLLTKEGRPDAEAAPVTAAIGAAMPEPPSNMARWLDPDWVVTEALHRISHTWWGGEALPSYLMLAGWVVSLGGQPRFGPDTIWFEPLTSVDLSQPTPFRNRADDPWIARYRALYLAMAQAAGWDRFLVGKPTLLPANDLLSMHMGTQPFLIALMDEPDWMAAAILQGARDQLRVRFELAELVRPIHRFWYGNAGWMPFWAPEPYAGTQSDVSCMLSPEQFERFVVPELLLYGQSVGALWYHLDGGNARQHLPRLLALPTMRVMQYVPTPGEPPNGREHLPLYRAIQEAGCIVHVQVAVEEVEPLVRALDPALLMLETAVTTPDEGGELLAAVERWTAARWGRAQRHRPGVSEASAVLPPQRPWPRYNHLPRMT